MRADMKSVECCGINVFDVVCNKRLQTGQLFAVAKIKLGEPCVAHAGAACNFVQFFFNNCGELEIDECGEVIFQQAHHGEGSPGWNERLAFLPHVATVDDGAQD